VLVFDVPNGSFRAHKVLFSPLSLVILVTMVYETKSVRIVAAVEGVGFVY